MQFPVEVKIEPSKSGKTFGVALVKGDKTLIATKACRLVNGPNGPFVSGPSSKMDDGSWLNYLFMDKDFGAYVTKLAVAAMDAPAPKAKNADYDDSVPF